MSFLALNNLMPSRHLDLLLSVVSNLPSVYPEFSSVSLCTLSMENLCVLWTWTTAFKHWQAVNYLDELFVNAMILIHYIRSLEDMKLIHTFDLPVIIYSRSTLDGRLKVIVCWGGCSQTLKDKFVLY